MKINWRGRWPRRLCRMACIAALLVNAPRARAQGGAGRIFSYEFAPTIAAGKSHSMAVKVDGAVVCWGLTNDDRCAVPDPNTNFMRVAGGEAHSLGLKTNGPIACWGTNGYEQCDVPVPNTNFVGVAAGYKHSLGLKRGGTIIVWGWTNYDQYSVPAPNTNFTAIAAGWAHSMGLRSDGSVACWGYNVFSQCNVPAPNTGFVGIAAGDWHSMGLKDDGSIVCWGMNGNGQCNVPAPNTNFIGVAGGGSHSLGLKIDGSVVCWGQTNKGQCDVPAPNTNFVVVAGGLYHSMGLKSDATIVCWGYTNDGRCDVPAPNSDFLIPEDSGVSPDHGPVWGGTTVTILGTNLCNGSDATNVTLCEVAATNIVSQSATQVVVQTAPAAFPTNGDVVICSTTYGMTTADDVFTYYDYASVSTRPVSDVTTTNALGGGEVNFDGLSPVTLRGICWASTTNPTIADSLVSSGSGEGVFLQLTMTGLVHSTLYHVRAWASNEAGVSYGEDVPFRTLTEGAISLSPTLLTFTSFYGATPPIQNFTVSNAGENAFSYTNALTYGVGESNWFQVGPATGRLAAAASRLHSGQVILGGMNVGTYYATNAVTSDTATNSPQILLVTYTINRATGSVYLAGLSQTYDGTARVVTATTVPEGLTVDLTYEGNPWAPTNAGTYAVTGTINEANYEGGSTGMLVVAKADQTIDFPHPGDQVTTSKVGLAATATSDLPVSFNVDSGPGQITGSTNLSFTGAGSVSVIASQVGDANWNRAPDVTNALNVSKADADVTLHGLKQVYDGAPRVVTATTVPPALTVDMTYDGSPSAPVNAGAYAVTGTVNDTMYQGSDTGTLVVLVLEFVDICTTNDGVESVVLKWLCSTNDFCDVYRATNLLNDYEMIGTNVPIVADTNTFTHPVGPAGWYFYRLDVE